jgi:hypothetical protein
LKITRFYYYLLNAVCHLYKALLNPVEIMRILHTFSYLTPGKEKCDHLNCSRNRSLWSVLYDVTVLYACSVAAPCRSPARRGAIVAPRRRAAETSLCTQLLDVLACFSTVFNHGTQRIAQNQCLLVWTAASMATISVDSVARDNAWDCLLFADEEERQAGRRSAQM